MTQLQDLAAPAVSGTEAGPRPAWWVARTPFIGLALLYAGLMRHLVAAPGDPDTWWHLRAGEHLWQTWSFSGPDPWNRFATRPWVLHEWLPELLASKVFSLAGLPGLAGLMCVAVAALILVTYLCARRVAEPLVAVVMTAFGVGGMSGSLSLRPQIVTFILSVVFTTAWLASARDLRPRWWLVPLTWLWACSHGMWFCAVIIGGATVVALALDRTAAPRQVWRLALVPTAGLVAAALTPVGPRLLLAPLAVGDVTQFVTEWLPPSIREVPTAMTIGMAAVTLLVWARGRARVSWVHLALLVVATGWALLYARSVAIGAAMLVPLCAGAVQSLLARPTGPVRRHERWLVGGITAGFLVVAACLVPMTARAPAGTPNRLDTQLDALPRGTVVLNEYALGGWLLWRHPSLAPVIDGRAEVFDPAYIRRYMSAASASSGWRGFLTQTGARTALVAQGSPLATALQERLAWRQTGSDMGYVLLQAPTSSP